MKKTFSDIKDLSVFFCIIFKEFHTPKLTSIFLVDKRSSSSSQINKITIASTKSFMSFCYFNDLIYGSSISSFEEKKYILVSYWFMDILEEKSSR